MRQPRWETQGAILRILGERGDWTTLGELTAFVHHAERFWSQAEQAYYWSTDDPEGG